jgi:hypothetical protein
MSLSVFDDKDKRPQPKELQRELGRSATQWQALVGWLAERYDPLVQEWVFAGQKWGWSLRLKHKKRAILYLTPCKKYFRVGFVLGEKAARTAMGMDLPESVVKQIKAATKYAEGRAIRLDIRHRKDLAAVKQLAEAKMTN